jgi:16S rRNA U1498 N3-methylase RsmE
LRGSDEELILENLWEGSLLEAVTSPPVLIGGAALAILGSQKGRKTIRKVLLMGLTAVMSIAAEASQFAVDAKKEWQEIVQESKTDKKEVPNINNTAEAKA